MTVGDIMAKMDKSAETYVVEQTSGEAATKLEEPWKSAIVLLARESFCAGYKAAIADLAIETNTR